MKGLFSIAVLFLFLTGCGLVSLDPLVGVFADTPEPTIIFDAGQSANYVQTVPYESAPYEYPSYGAPYAETILSYEYTAEQAPYEPAPYVPYEGNGVNLVTATPGTYNEADEPPIHEVPLDVSGGDSVVYRAAEALSNEAFSWYFVRGASGLPPRGQQTAGFLRPFDAFFIGDTTVPRVYLTFDQGYEAGFTSTILDILYDRRVTAAFFVTKPYINRNPGLIIRKVQEGHLVAGHSVTHVDMTTQTDGEIAAELLDTARAFTDITGQTMDPFFRPPEGIYSERTLALTQEHGFVTVFWSFAHRDWIADEQPGRDVTINRVMDNLHNGMILLLHGVSESNTEALPYIIDKIRSQGFTFGTLYELLY